MIKCYLCGSKARGGLKLSSRDKRDRVREDRETLRGKSSPRETEEATEIDMRRQIDS